jgi:4-diphosphocytidyl-2-C-methyl-D-erythritol kinase
MPPGIRAPAKINLTLEVLARRDDGFHGIRSVMVPLELADTIDVAPDDRLTFTCDPQELGGDENLALRAVRAVETAAKRAIGARVALVKRIPTQAGLGGGSSDAAAILDAAMEGRFGDLPPLDWLGIARNLGSDVPFFLSKTAALVEGTGERVTALGAPPRWSVLVVKPPASIATADAYAALDAVPRVTRPRSDSISLQCAQALQRRDFGTVQGLLANDFHDLAMEKPHVRQAVEALRDAGAERPLLAGSGSCVFALTPDATARDAIVDRVHLPPEFTVFRTAFAHDNAWRDEARA